MSEIQKFHEVEALQRIVSRNLNSLRLALGWSQARFADETGVVPSTFGNYLKCDTKDARLPSLDYLVGLCNNEKIIKQGFQLTLDLLVSEKFDPKPQAIPIEIVRKQVEHSDFLGNYLCYFFDCSKPTDNADERLNRELRYGVISVFEERATLTGEVYVRALAFFYKEEESEKAFELKRQLDAVPNGDVDKRNSGIADAFKAQNALAYDGRVTFSEHHTFINIQSDVYGDDALIILYSPQKKTNSDYIGGMGCVTSVSRGRAHMPTAQRIVLSKYELGCSNEMLAERLSIPAAAIEQEKEAERLCEFCRKLYADPQYAQMFDDDDKSALIRRRLDQLVKNYINKNICCTVNVTEDEDRSAYKLIDQYRNGETSFSE